MRTRAWRTGSSPLARGLPCTDTNHAQGLRIIPARAGFTTHNRPRVPTHRDHPRSRGVYGEQDADRLYFFGSSPLARGLPVFRVGRRIPEGIIPARAGFTPLLSTTIPPYPDHPRSRGVYGRGVCSASHFEGSSPLARGLLCIKIRLSAYCGIIPARAGFT